ncbi:HesA/MoeB/ThiF family protein [Thiorhodovibrio frisius]|uniref:Molybdopterin-synthase adenylyltransferase n=1 Tax=Thiorhodovibrio frisius TaxID=631362 RepID=H8Z2W5_9GAMM|nr:molybdopterin-synthase adenylyltransferase MoeB [Thiorhodovibrio frisius]EIC21701.1 dinucleotide-utilizing enzyme possibly involved in molybdopterin or thiamin biosynthesis [Thiorhodovibrio frisius]WPL21669.1 Molybdopterin-synthase adenylyltransferase [Thiorhodovibrio frisius]
MPSAKIPATAADDDLLLRYQRQILLPDFGIEGQERLGRARVLVLGLGGLGSPVALYLAAAGLGTLLLADGDQVDQSNLQRQILHDQAQIGQSKVDSATARLRALNTDVHLVPIREHLDDTRLHELAAEVDLIVDGSDNFATRFAANRASVAAGVPLVSGAAIRAEGQISAFSGRAGGPCYQCLYPDIATNVDDGCAANGVLAPLVGIIGSLQACEAIKILSGIGTPLFGRLLLLDARPMHWRELQLSADPSCPVCATAPAPPTA